MLKIETFALRRFRLTGDLTARHLPLLAEALHDATADSPATVELDGLRTVDRAAVEFLASRPEAAVRLLGGCGYVRQWIGEERKAAASGGRGAGSRPAAVALAALATLLLAAPARADEPLRLSLRDAIARALRAGTPSRLADVQVRGAEAAVRGARAALLPAARFDVQRSNQSIDLSVFGIPAPDPIVPPFDAVEAKVSASAPLLDLAALRRYRAARADRAVSEAERARIRSEAAAAVARLYIGVQRADAQARQIDSNVQLFERLLDLARHQREAGVGSRLDTTRAEVQLQQQRQSLLGARERSLRARLVLLEALAADLGAEVVLTDALDATPAVAPPLDEALAAALAHRPELESLRQQRRSADLATGAVRAERLPVVRLQAQAAESANAIADLRYTRGIGVQVAVPLYTGGRIGAALGQAQARQQALEIQEGAVARLVERQVRDALVALATARERLGSAETIAALAGDELTMAQHRFETGIAPSIEVDNAQTAYAGAREQLVAAQADLAQAGIDLQFATGALVP